MIRRWVVAAALVLALTPRPAHALLSLCAFSLSPTLSFGTYVPTASSPLDGTGTFSYDCLAVLGGGALTISLSAGEWGTLSQRRMASGSYRMNYQLYLDAGRNQVWGDGTNGTVVYGPVSLPVVLGHVGETRIVYGRIPAGQTGVGVGTYTDNVTITINF